MYNIHALLVKDAHIYIQCVDKLEFVMVNPKFSIIIPVYNTETYLSKTLDSILSQDYQDFEIICINDGSTDNSLALLEDYKKKDNRITVLNQSNQGVATARNLGLEHAKNEYIVFVDSEDFVTPNWLKDCSKALSEDTDIVIFGLKTYYEKTEKSRAGQYSSKNFPKNFKIYNLFSYHTICSNKVYRRDFLINNNINFRLQKTGEEQLFFIKSMFFAKKVTVLKKDLYFYRKNRNGALTEKVKTFDLSAFKTFKEVSDFLNEITIKTSLSEKIKGRYLSKILTKYSKIPENNIPEYEELLRNLLKELKNDKKISWGKYYVLPKNNNYFNIKLNLYFAKLEYLLRETLIFIPAAIIFGFYLLTMEEDK